MARAIRVKSSRKPHYCPGGGGHEIPVPEGYYWAAPGFRASKKYRCLRHPFRQSELTSGLASEPLAAVEAFEDRCDEGFESIEDLSSAWDEVKSACEDYMSQRQDSLDQWPNGNESLQELYDRAEAASEEAENFEPAEFDEEEPEQDSFSTEEAYTLEYAAWEERRDEHIEEQANEARDLATSLEF